MTSSFGRYDETPPPQLGEYLQNIGMLMKHVHKESICTYATRIDAGWVQIAL